MPESLCKPVTFYRRWENLYRLNYATETGELQIPTGRVRRGQKGLRTGESDT